MYELERICSLWYLCHFIKTGIMETLWREWQNWSLLHLSHGLCIQQFCHSNWKPTNPGRKKRPSWVHMFTTSTSTWYHVHYHSSFILRKVVRRTTWIVIMLCPRWSWDDSKTVIFQEMGQDGPNVDGSQMPFAPFYQSESR